MATSRFTLIAFLLIMPTHPVFSADDSFEYKVQTQVRFDDRSNREHRFQYRVRAYSSFHIPNSRWRINAFGVTGNEFSSSYNTIDSDISNHFNLRRIYFKHTGALGSKTEIGVIPTYKGRVSSSGLAKDGWIKGARHVYAYSAKAKFEIVLGELEEDTAKTALDAFKKLNYVELEMSSYINDVSSYEISLERMTQANFVRAEYRLFLEHSPIYSVELISRVSTSKTKIVIGIEDSLTLFGKDAGYYAYYSYVSDNFGARAELTEDFITTGHGLSIESDIALLNLKNWKAFARLDLFDQNSRFILGVGYTFG
ncbi:hypothetical protein [Glaciecola sp. 33A]|uniref:hypothetical protein n=1 Tax=Glaciecola sp. 33A TaxID=2057807 RepID=UPI000C33FD75|nr:hypothetical protein [Glaciecola sp. 33A]PKI01781.1 hypothetical protein CXF81_10185 [Glaciecola sp. 33A]